MLRTVIALECLPLEVEVFRSSKISVAQSREMFIIVILERCVNRIVFPTNAFTLRKQVLCISVPRERNAHRVLADT